MIVADPGLTALIPQSSALKIKSPHLQIQASSTSFKMIVADAGLTALIPQSSALKIKSPHLQIQASLICRVDFLFIRDREGIRTPNPQSRNLIFYPVELRSQYFSF